MKNKVTLLVVLAAVFTAMNSNAAWTYVETNETTKVHQGVISNEVWAFYAERSKTSDTDLTVNTENGLENILSQDAPIDFTEIDGGYKVVAFAGKQPLALRTYVTEFVAPHCTKLTGSDLFNGNTKLTRVVCREDGLPEIAGDRMFLNCSNLKEIVPNKIGGEDVKLNMFDGCSSLSGRLEFPECILFRTKNNFNNCSLLQEVVAPNVTELPQAAFSECSSLTNVQLSASLSVIGVKAFANSGISTDAVNRFLNSGVTQIGKYQSSGGGSWQSESFCGCNLPGEIVWNLPSLETNVVPNRCFKGAVLNKIVFKTPIDTFEGEAFYGVKASGGKATELYMPAKVPAEIKKNAFMTAVPYAKVYLSENHEEWIRVLGEEGNDHIVITREEWEDEDRAWTSDVNTSMDTWNDITTRMAHDETMCKKEGSGNSAVFTVYDKNVIAFAMVYGSSGGHCWILRIPEKGFSVILR